MHRFRDSAKCARVLVPKPTRSVSEEVIQALEMTGEIQALGSCVDELVDRRCWADRISRPCPTSLPGPNATIQFSVRANVAGLNSAEERCPMVRVWRSMTCRPVLN